MIDLMPEQEDIEDKGGTMRLGAYPCKVLPGSRAHEAYGEELIYERHRHRYEVNNAYRDTLTKAGLTISGVSPDGSFQSEMVFKSTISAGSAIRPSRVKSRPTKPHPLFVGFVNAARQ